MGNELTVLDQGGLGVDFSNRLFKLAPATININQPNTQIEGAIRGKLRISETGQQFDEMIVTLLKMPVEQRAYYAGKTEQLNRTPENLLCFSRDLIRPDKAAKEPQAPYCKSCPQGDAAWEKWRQTRDKKDIPQCDAYFYALFIDTVYKMPLQMYIRSKNKDPFKAGMQNLARTLFMMKSQGLNPNIFDVKFKLKTRRIMTGAYPSYVIDLSDFEAISPEDQQDFGNIYQQYVSRDEYHDQVMVEDDSIEADGNIIDARLSSISDYDGEDIKP